MPGRVISARNLERLRSIIAALRDILNNAGQSPDDEFASKAVYLTRAADGSRLLGLLSSNAYIDREDDIASLQALTEWVDSQWQGEQYIGKGKALFWHAGEAIGDIVYSDMAGAFLVEIVKECQNPFARAIFDLIERTQNTLEWGASIGVWAVRDSADTRVFHVRRKPETSILPALYAGNPYTYTELTKMNTAQKIVRRLWLKRHAPDAAAIEQKLREAAEAATDKLDSEGLERKSLETTLTAFIESELAKAQTVNVEGLANAVTEMVGELLGEKSPEDLPERITRMVQEYVTDADLEDEAMSAYETEKTQREKTLALIGNLVESQDAFADLPAEIEKLAGIPAEVAKQVEPLKGISKSLDDLSARIAALEGIMTGEVKPASQDGKTIVRKNSKLLKEAEEAAREKGNPNDPWNRMLTN